MKAKGKREKEKRAVPPHTGCRDLLLIAGTLSLRTVNFSTLVL
jgi:hypothetical protein